ncbi:MAG: stage 0 sporulation protein [Myxococcales bacterium]|nr:stage 0 sporulation protein [Myxococcales bacterium]
MRTAEPQVRSVPTDSMRGATVHAEPAPRTQPAPSVKWGDDADAPTPVLRLVADLPSHTRDPHTEDVFPEAGLAGENAKGRLAQVAGVRIAAEGRLHEVDAGDGAFVRGDRVVFESDRGALVGTVALAGRRCLVTRPLPRILRAADARDEDAVRKNTTLVAEGLACARQHARTHRPSVKVFHAEAALGGGRLLLYVAGDERADVRELVRVVSQKLKLRVEVRQTGARDEAKIVGGIGSCGRELCCTTFLPRFDPVSIKMAKDQGLSLNPQKLTGQCGRLKCCLVYEQATYVEMKKGMPNVGKRVITPAGEGRVVELDVMRRRVRVALQPGEYETFPSEVVTPAAPPQSQSPRGGGAPPAAESENADGGADGTVE